MNALLILGCFAGAVALFFGERTIGSTQNLGAELLRVCHCVSARRTHR